MLSDSPPGQGPIAVLPVTPRITGRAAGTIPVNGLSDECCIPVKARPPSDEKMLFPSQCRSFSRKQKRNEIKHAARALSRYRDARRTRILRIRLRLTVCVKKAPSLSRDEAKLSRYHPDSRFSRMVLPAAAGCSPHRKNGHS